MEENGKHVKVRHRTTFGKARHLIAFALFIIGFTIANDGFSALKT